MFMKTPAPVNFANGLGLVLLLSMRQNHARAVAGAAYHPADEGADAQELQSISFFFFPFTLIS